MLTSARLQSETISILITILSFGFLDLLSFALIQRGSVFFWMHACPKNGGYFCYCRRQQSYFPEKTKATQRIAARLCNYVACQYYARPSVCRVGLSTAEVTANPLSDWNAATVPRVCGPRRPSIAPT